MKAILRFLPLPVAAAVLAGYGTVHGVWTSRWATSEQLLESGSRLAQVSMDLGDWLGRAGELDGNDLTVGEITGYLARHYVHRHTGERLTVFMACGRPGPMAVHTPDICYERAGYRQVAPQTLFAAAPGVPGPPAEFWVAKFSKEEPTGPDQMRVFWSWSATGEWLAPANPRPAFARHRALYKLYVIRRLARSDEPVEDGPAAEFLRLFLPELQRCLFPDP